MDSLLNIERTCINCYYRFFCKSTCKNMNEHKFKYEIIIKRDRPY